MKLHVSDFTKARVLVVGDLMLDRYWHGVTARISPEAPVPVVRVTENQELPGGAGNVALNIAALGARTLLDGYTGDDAHADALRAFLERAGVRCEFERVPGLTTIVKLRVISRHQQLIRLDFEDGFYQHNAQRLTHRFRELLNHCDVVVLSDYNKGTLTAVGELIRLARAAGKPVLVDPKGKNFNIYHGATLLTPNMAEFTTIVGECKDESELEAKGAALRERLELDALLITRGEHGMTLLQNGQDPLHLPAQAREVFDVTGAGDTVIAVLAAALATGQSLAEATALSNVAAGLVVAKLGAATVTPQELRDELDAQAMHNAPAARGIVSEERLIQLVHAAKAKGERIVMTNGCFDLLHVGHVTYLEQAKQRGDRLIVAVNDDDSVRRLKGESRPINALDNRMAVIAGLRSVDWAVSFSEDTPERLICRVLPDVLVKGGDYRPEQIAGHRCVIDNGGEVVILDFVPGHSTSKVVSAIQERK